MPTPLIIFGVFLLLIIIGLVVYYYMAGSAAASASSTYSPASGDPAVDYNAPPAGTTPGTTSGNSSGTSTVPGVLPSGASAGATTTPGGSPGMPPITTSGYPPEFDRLTLQEKNITMSGYGTVGTLPTWPRPAFISSEAPSDVETARRILDQAIMPANPKFVAMDASPNILGCEAQCKSSGKCLGGSYYFRDETKYPQPPTGRCFARIEN